MLLNLGADANKRDNHGRTALHDACNSKGTQFVDITRTLLCVANAQVTALTNEGCSPLFYFIQGNPSDSAQFMDTITLMIEKGADINSQTNSGETVAHKAAELGNVGLVHFFIQKGAELNRRTKYDFILSIEKIQLLT